MPELGHARGVRRTQVPASDHRQPHASEGTRAAWTGGFGVVNAAHRDVVGQPGKRGGPLAEKVRRGPIAENHRKFGVKLGECGAKGTLAGRVGAAPEVAGDGERSMREKISEAECTHALAVRLLSRFARSCGSLSSAALRAEGSRSQARRLSSLPRGTRDPPSRSTTPQTII